MGKETLKAIQDPRLSAKEAEWVFRKLREALPTVKQLAGNFYLNSKSSKKA